MEAHGIPNTPINRERATAELIRAKADTLLAASSRYPEAGGLGLGDLVADDFDTVPFDEIPSAADEEPTSTGEPSNFRR